MRPWECTHTDRQRDRRTRAQTETNWIYNLSYAICYSCGADNSVEQTAVTVTFIAFEISVTAQRTSPAQSTKSLDADKTVKRSLISFFSKIICLSVNPTDAHRSSYLSANACAISLRMRYTAVEKLMTKVALVTSIFILWFLVSSFFLFFSHQRQEIGCLPYFHKWCGLSANLGCRSETCCTRIAENAGRKNRQKVAICAPSYNFVGLYLRN